MEYSGWRASPWTKLRRGLFGALGIAMVACGHDNGTSPEPASVTTVGISPATSTIEFGAATQLTAQTFDAAGHALTGHGITWSSSDVAVATVSSTGLVSGVAVGGPITITATSEGRSGTASVAVIAVPVASVTVSAGSTLEVGASAQLTAQPFDAAGHVLTGRAISWSSSNAAVASVSPTGLVTGVAAGGPITITATSEGRSGVATVAVIPIPVASVAVSSQATIEVGASAQLTAQALDATGHALTGRTFTWLSSNVALASVSPTGLVSGVAVGGPITITATSEGRSGTATISVIPIPVASVTVSPGSAAVYVGSIAALVAQTKSAIGTVLTGRDVTWSSSNPAIASVSSTGVVRGVSAGGSVTISATSETRIGTATITVSAVPATMIVTGIRDPVAFINRCPTNDPAYNTIHSAFQVLRDGVPSTVAITCTEPYPTAPIEQLTDELLAMQTMRIVYYMSQGTAGKLPWTTLPLYEWMTSEVAGVNIVSAPGNSGTCCQVFNGKKYFSFSKFTLDDLNFFRDWNFVSARVGLFAHEVRHASGPGHVRGCPAFPLPTDPLGCDASYDLTNLGSYGVQYWLFSNWATGLLNVGIGCATPSVAQNMATTAASTANVYPSRFVANAPPAVTATTPYGGSCFPP